MFDNVGTHNDEEATKRSFLSLLLTSCLVGAGAAFTVAVTTYQVVDTLGHEETVDDGPIVMAELDRDEIDVPDLPPPPAVAAKGIADAPEQDAPEEAPEDVAPLEPVKDEIVDQGPVKGIAEGVDGGDPKSTFLGPPGGTCRENCGPVGGTGEGEPLVFHHTDLQVRKRVQPRYPQSAQGLGEQRCIARVKMDQKGIPYDVRVDGCATSLHEATRDALLKWRWYPPKRNKQRVRASTRISVVYKD